MADYDQTIGVKLDDDFSSLQKSLTALNRKMQTLMGTMQQIISYSSQIGLIASQFRQISDSMAAFNSNASSSKNVFKNLSTTGLDNAMSKLKSMQAQYTELIKRMSSGSLMSAIKSSNDTTKTAISSITPYGINDDTFGTRNKQIISYIRQLENAKRKTAELGKESTKTGSKIKSMFSIGKIYFFFNYFKQVFRGIGNIITSALDFNEVENMFANAMKGMYSQAMAFQNKLSDMFGVAIPTTMQAQATYKNMLGNLGGISDELSYQLSEIVTKMTLDFASLYNVNFEDSVKKFQSLLSKQVRPIRSVSGYDITQSVLGMTAQEIGMSKTIGQANELEKRLLAVLTVYKQMGETASNAMNDFSRTIEQPSNQLRVMQEQISELGRWIGSIFMGTIGAILPYINGFLMALKEIAKTLAFLVGYELPDSSAMTGTLLDGVEDADDLSDSIGNIGSGLSDAKEKADALKGSLAGFDKLNIINKPKDSSSSGGSGGGTTGMTVDPALLKALEDMQYRFDDIRMKAMDIRDTLLRWADIIHTSITENIFKPIQDSWNKYGKSILSEFSSGFSNLGNLFVSVGTEFAKNFRPNIEAISDLFFSLLDTAGIVFNAITDALLRVWEIGGKDLYNGIDSLIRAFLNLMTSINDNFVKPLVKAFSSTLLPVFADFTGYVFKGIGGVIDLFADLVDWISNTKIVLVPLTGIVTGFVLAWNITKFASGFKILKDGLGTLGALRTILSNNVPFMRTFFNLFDSGKTKVSGFKAMYDLLNQSLSNVKVFKTLSDNLKNIGDKMVDSASKSTGLASVFKDKLGSVISWLGKNPMVVLAGAIGVVTAGIVGLITSQKEATYEMEDYSEHIQKNIEDLQNLRETMSSAKEEAEKSYTASLGEIETVERYVEKLNALSNEDGYVENINQAQLYIDKINEVMPDTVSLTDDYRLAWQKTPDEIQKTIDALKEKAKWEAYSKAYTDALSAQIEAERQIASATKERAEKQKELNDLLAQEKLTSEDYDRIKQLKADLDGLNVTIEEAEAAFEESTEAASYFSSEMQFTDEQVKKANENMSESFKSLSEDSQKELTDLSKELLSLKETHKQYIADGKSQNSKQVKDVQDSIRKQISEYAKLAQQYGLTYDDMLLTLQNYGVVLNDEEKAQLQKSMENANLTKDELAKVKEQQKNKLLYILKQQGIEEDSERYKQAIKALEDAQKNGADEAETFISNYASTINANKETVTKAGQSVGNALQATLNNLRPTATVYTNVDRSSLQSAVDIIGGKLNQIFSGLSGITGKLFGYASGGFPDVGQMFIAREKGPELVGTIGGRTAVANNYQIESGIEDAAFRGMARAITLMKGGNSNQPIVIENTFKIGEDTIAKQVKKADQDSIKKTGKGLLER